MTQDAFRAAIQSRIESNWTTTPIVYDDDLPIEHQENWVRVSIVHEQAFRAAIRQNLIRYPGFIEIEIYVATGKGIGNALRYADTISGIFRINTGERVGGAILRSPSVIQYGKTSGWYRVDVRVPFIRDEVH